MAKDLRSTGPAGVKRRREADRSGAPIPQGERNWTLFKRACSMRRAGFSGAAISDALMAENRECCKPRLPDHEVQTIARSAANQLPPWITNEPAFFADPRLRTSARHVLRVIVDHANASGGAFMSQDTIALETGLSRNTVGAAIRELESADRISVKHRAYTSNAYRVKAFTPQLILSANPPTPHPGSYGPIAGHNAAETGVGGVTAPHINSATERTVVNALTRVVAERPQRYAARASD
jgi:hypothetical protein